ncbi:MAG: hypothetical protein HY882_15680, partial [Deltaproteobacteria bacterium]|nr:hypothetical protein [Deltaproteobacteria bacterium]
FMERMVRWLTRDPSVNPAQIHLPEEARQIGQEMEVRISVQENPANPKGAVSFSVLNPEGVKIESSLRPGGKPGEYIGSFLPDKEGTYKLKVETLVGNLEESLIIAVPGEDLDGAPDFERLKWIAASTGGKLLSKGDDLLKEIAALAEKKQNRFLEEKLLPLWGMPYSLLIILALLAPEWYFRRRWGLI